mmetsp:Transcript_7306/g.8235  ORF Transcript_7306/g.8235 Transcript_7306/m.8235 type:complete len:209 (+) Transcript_7306:70-696(+)
MNPFDWAVAGVAIVGSNDKPMFTKIFFSRSEVARLPAAPIQAQLHLSDSEELQIQFLMHAALDLLSEKVSQRAVASSSSSSSAAASGSSGGVLLGSGGGGGGSISGGAADVRFLDKLMEEGSVAIHGFQSASGIRVLLATLGEAPRDAVLPLCRTIYEAASMAICNPFFQSISGDLCGGGLEDSVGFRDTLERTVGPYSVTSRSTRTA